MFVLFLQSVFGLRVLVDRITISPSTISTSMLSGTILEHTSDKSSDLSGSLLSNTTSDTSHSSTLIGSPTEEQESPENDSESRLKEDENLNVKEHIDISEDVGESDKEKITKEHNEKEQLSPPPESLREPREPGNTEGLESRTESTETVTLTSDSPINSNYNVVKDKDDVLDTPTPDNSDKMQTPWATMDSVAGSALRGSL